LGVIVDCFAFFNELDVLKIRLEELYPVVDRFVLVESDKTFRGQAKPYYFSENSGMFEKYLDKITVIKLIDDNDFMVDKYHEPWEREYWQRNQMMRGLTDCSPDDIIIISDVDEIPSRNTIANLVMDKIMSIELVGFSYSVNMHDNGFYTIKAIRYSEISTPQKVRVTPPINIIRLGGWHFSSLGDADHISHKLSSFAHWELDVPSRNNPEIIRRRMIAGEDILGDGHKYTRLTIDDSWPEEVKNNREYWRRYEL
jgi:beta-1,4-mannosyl-glycoprotein beta-1,4-N-acetylglucosaminyltransferase